MASGKSLELREITLNEPEELYTHDDVNREDRRAFAKRHKTYVRRGLNVPYVKADASA